MTVLDLDDHAQVAIVDFADENGTITLESGERVRFGKSSCSGLVPTVGQSVWVMALKQLPVVGLRATLVNRTGEAEPEDAETRTLLAIDRRLAAAEEPWRIDAALPWLRKHPRGFGAQRFAEAGSALVFAEELRSRGASSVALGGVGRGKTPTSMEVALPPDPAARARLFELVEREWRERGEDFSCDPSGRGGSALTREEAIAMQDPSAEGEWAVEDGAPCDAGQDAVTLWWD